MTERDKSRYTEGSVNIGGSVGHLLVHSQSSDDEQRHYAKSQVCTVLRRRVPPCAETSATALFSCPRSVER
ncbi:hypothetical protein EVAR_62870_1 [Eumeta japonica]|nr:hypothetical protein EVAR_7159_1 [Eumeta japonica]GBP81994.1 hypothetical protein EVAR_62870_1 [Eumeta japonica]